MPRYFFTRYDDDAVRDPEGRELPDDEAAFNFALSEVRSLAGYVMISTGAATLSPRIEVADEDGRLLAKFCVGAAIKSRDCH